MGEADGTPHQVTEAPGFSHKAWFWFSVVLGAIFIALALFLRRFYPAVAKLPLNKLQLSKLRLPKLRRH
jgi:hypothetical protein